VCILKAGEHVDTSECPATNGSPPFSALGLERYRHGVELVLLVPIASCSYILGDQMCPKMKLDDIMGASSKYWFCQGRPDPPNDRLPILICFCNL
jgi:hypothetical protein